jgi:hypothetical protein
MTAEPSRTASALPGTLLSCLPMRAGPFRRLLLLLRPRRPRPDRSIRALAAIGDDELCNLSESGLRLRREARHRSCGAWLSAGVVVLMSAAQVVARPACSPALTIARTHLSEVRESTSERRWTAAVSVDAARCAPVSSGDFHLVVSRLKENGPDLRFRERFAWHPPAVTAEVAFWADEAVARAWIEAVTPCPCAP